MSFIDAVHKTGRGIHEQWSLAGMNESAFAGAAQDALAEARLHEHFDLSEVVQWLADSDDVPAQRGVDNFGEPALTLFNSRGFYIELYFWLRPDTSIHDHGFAGAFTVLSGSSLQIEYRFTAAESRGNAQLGPLEAACARMMHRGDVSPIYPGTGLIHQVWHLDRPTVSLVARTDTASLAGGQRNYYPPGLAVANSRYSESAGKRARLLAHLVRTGAAADIDAVLPFFRERDPTGTFYAWLQLDRLTPDSSTGEAIRAHVTGMLGALGERMAAALEHDRLQRVLDFSRIVDTDQRFLCALLLSPLSRGQILESLSNRCGRAGVGSCVVRWLSGIVKALGEEPVDDDFALDIIELAARGRTYPEIQSAIIESLQLAGPEQFEPYYREVQNLALFSRLLPAGPEPA